MAPEWEAAAMELGIGMGTNYHHNAPPPPPPPPAATLPAPAHYHFYSGAGNLDGGQMRVDDMLDLSSHLGAHDFFPAGGNASGNGAHHHHHAAGPQPIPATAASSFNLSFADEFYIPVPTEEAAELEWLSNFVDDSYPDVPSYPPAVQAAMAAAARNGAGAERQQEMIGSSASAPGRGARSKRSRAASAAAAAWHALVPRQAPSPSSSSSSSSDLSSSKPARTAGSGGKVKTSLGESSAGAEAATDQGGGVRRCTHCASEKTPQWRTGPLGPKTLCNACGVRYKSGRLVPEYRPAASPTFVLTQHSNSHRKVMELRRQNELLHLRGGAASSGSGGAGPEPHMFRDYGVC